MKPWTRNSESACRNRACRVDPVINRDRPGFQLHVCCTRTVREMMETVGCVSRTPFGVCKTGWIRKERRCVACGTSAEKHRSNVQETGLEGVLLARPVLYGMSREKQTSFGKRQVDRANKCVLFHPHEVARDRCSSAAAKVVTAIGKCHSRPNKHCKGQNLKKGV